MKEQQIETSKSPARYIIGYLIGCTYIFPILIILLAEKLSIVPDNDTLYTLIKLVVFLMNVIFSAFVIGLPQKFSFKNWFILFSQPFIFLVPTLVIGLIAPEIDVSEQQSISLIETLVPFLLTVVFSAVYSLIASTNPLELMLDKWKVMRDS